VEKGIGEVGSESEHMKFLFWSDENVLKLTEVMDAHVYVYTENQQIVHFAHHLSQKAKK
jgi:hypothetical protein